MVYLTAMLLAILSTIFYHLIARAIPAGVHPLVTLSVTYLTAAAACIVLLPFFRTDAGFGASIRSLNWTSFALGLAIIGIELGFLLAYRAGWNISLAAIVANVAVTVILLPIGVLAFKERLSLAQVIGMIICVIGLVLINRK
jgi:drug/metabolite transporter (DMT)-like permease